MYVKDQQIKFQSEHGTIIEGTVIDVNSVDCVMFVCSVLGTYHTVDFKSVVSHFENSIDYQIGYI